MSHNKIFWGSFLIIFGILILFENYLGLRLRLENILKFWPIILILIGLRILIKDKLFGSALVVISAIFFSFLFYVLIFKGITCNRIKIFNKEDKGRKELISQNILPSIKYAELNFNYNLGEFYLNTTSNKLIEGEVVIRSGDYIFDGEIKDTIAVYQLEEKYKSNLKILGTKILNRAELSINPEPVWKINLSNNFANYELNLVKAKLDKLNLKSNFSRGEIFLQPESASTKIDLDLNFSTLKIKKPKEVGIEIFINKTLSDIELNHFEEVKPNHYKSENYDISKQKISLNITANFSKLSITN